MSTSVALAAGAVLALFVVLALLRPRVMLVTLVALDVSNLNGVVADHLGTSPYKPQLALATLVLVVMACRGRVRLCWSPVLLGLLVLLAGFCLSFVQAADPTTSALLLGSRARDLFYFLVVFVFALSVRSPALLARTSVLVLAGLAGLTAVHEFVLHDVGDLYGLSRVPLVQEGGALTPRHAGTSSDVNFWARLLVLFTPLAMSLAAAGRGTWTRLLWLGCTLSLLVGVYLTQSRGGFIALFLTLVCWLALAGGRYRRSIALVPVALAVLVPLTGIGSRLLTLASGSSASADPSVVTRKRLQLDAWHMFLDHPVFGHGIGSYGTLFPTYDRTSNAYEPVDIVVAAHNFYLEQAADGGVVLLLAWAVLAGTVLFVAVRSMGIARDGRDQTGRFLSVGVVAGVVGWGTASLFLHLSDFRALLLVAALAAGLDVQARQQAVPRVVTAARATAGHRRLALAGSAAAFLTTAAGLGVALHGSAPSYVSTSTLAVVPSSSSVDGSTAYQVDVVSRGEIVPTLTAVLDRSLTATDLRRSAGVAGGTQTQLSVTQSRLGGSILVSVTGSDAQVVDAYGATAVARSKDVVAGLNSSYRLSGSATGSRVATGLGRRLRAPLAAAVLVSLVLFVRALGGRRGADPADHVR